MNNLEKRKLAYKNALIEINNSDLLKVDKLNYYYPCKDEQRLLYLIGKINNWENYLTVKQLEVARIYISTKNTHAIDTQLKLTNGTTYHRLFGSSKSQKVQGGALRKLEKIYKDLNILKKIAIPN